MAIIADSILTGVKRRISMPASQVLLQDTDILAFADDAIKAHIIPMLESTNQEYFVTSEDIPLVASTSEYNIPYRATGRSFRELKLKSSTDSTDVRNLQKISIEDLQIFSSQALPMGFYFKGDRFVLVPDVSSSAQVDLIEAWYRLAPSNLVALAEVSTVVSVTSTIVTVDTVPSTFTVSTPIDFIQGVSGNRIYSIDKSPTAVGSTTITFAAGTIPSTLIAGDYIALAGESPVANMIPNEVYPYLESVLAKRCLRSIGDFEGARELNDDISEEKKNLLKILEPRIDGEPTVIINRTGLVRGQKFGQRSWLYGQ